MPGNLLVADDDDILREFAVRALRELGHNVDEARTFDEALDRARRGTYDLWIFDRRMPGGDGAAALRALRAEGLSTPALMLTAATTVEARVEGLDAGADDYLTKPFALAELAARVRAMLRRPHSVADSAVRTGTVSLYLEECRAISGEDEFSLTASEWRLVWLLTRQPGATRTRRDIAAACGLEAGTSLTAVDHLVSRLRRKLLDHGAGAAIRTVRGVGFSWSGQA